MPVTARAGRPDSFSPAATASPSARHQVSGSLSRAPPSPVTTCGARPTASCSPVPASMNAALVDWVELSTPMTTAGDGMGASFALRVLVGDGRAFGRGTNKLRDAHVPAQGPDGAPRRMRRSLRTAGGFRVPGAVCLISHDTEQIGVPGVGRVPRRQAKAVGP